MSTAEADIPQRINMMINNFHLMLIVAANTSPVNPFWIVK